MTGSTISTKLLICPGDTIRETIDTIGMTQRELAERLNYPTNKLNQLIQGEVSLTREMAAKLEHVLGIPATTWLELERFYQADKLAIEEAERLYQQLEWLDHFPLSKMKKLGIIRTARKGIGQVEELLSFFQVASREAWNAIYIAEKVSVAFKISLAQTRNPHALAVWLKQGEYQAAQLTLADYDEQQFRACLQHAREIAHQQPDDFLEQLQTLGASCGVAIVYTPALPRAPVSGATRWLKKRRHPLIQLSDRYKTADHFWFAFFHEAVHILHHGKTEIFLEGVPEIEQNEAKEKEANTKAERYLLGDFPLQQYAGQLREWRTVEIQALAAEYGLHPGILVAQLQRVGSVDKGHLNKWKVKIRFENSYHPPPNAI